MPFGYPVLRMRALLLGLLLLAQACACDDTLSEVHEFGDNPGGLRMFEYVPELAAGAEASALVVMLHGCSQTHGVARSSGLLGSRATSAASSCSHPNKARSTTATCASTGWRHEDTGRAGGEAQSIGDIIDSARTHHGVDPARTFIAGLSAGAAMAVSVAASFPSSSAAPRPWRAALAAARAVLSMRRHAWRATSRLTTPNGLTACAPQPGGRRAGLRRLAAHAGVAGR